MSVVTVALAPAADGLDWETLVTGLLAVVAAGAAILQNNWFEQRRLNRQSHAARVTMPLVLSEVVRWSMDVAVNLIEVLDANAGHSIISVAARKAMPRPKPPNDIVERLKEVVQATDDAAVVRRISKLAGNMQTLVSRIEGMDDAHLIVSDSSFAGHIVQAFTIHAQAESLFRYARLEAETTPQLIDWDEVRKCLDILSAYGHAGRAVASYIADFEAYTDPENRKNLDG